MEDAFVVRIVHLCLGVLLPLFISVCVILKVHRSVPYRKVQRARVNLRSALRRHLPVLDPQRAYRRRRRRARRERL